ncbi:MAG: carbohydrate binding domain-containing protein [Spirochaetes bacterium]|nr:carbohydrate binding domain-containing protein [Spirochaetota bacterium]
MGFFRVLAVCLALQAAAFAEENLVKNPGFEDPADLSAWNLNNWAKNEVSGVFDAENPRRGKLAYRVTIKKVLGTPELHLQQKTDLKPGGRVRLRFSLRGSGSKPVSVLIRKIGAPWTPYLARTVKISKEWKDYSFSLILPEIDPADTGLFFILGEAANLWVDEVSLTPLADGDASMADQVNSLDGIWSVRSGSWQQEVAVPGFLENFPGTKALHEFTFSRALEIPELGDERRLFVRFDAVGDGAEVWVNGQHAGGHVGAALPFEVDITGFVESPSVSNRLEVVVRDDTYFSTPRESSDWRNRKHWIPRGMGTGNRKGILQGVSLVARPLVHVSDAFIRTSVREKTLRVAFELVNGKKEAQSARLECTVLSEKGETVMALPATAVELPGYVMTPVSVSAAFSGVTLWQPDHPALYTLRTRLFGKSGVLLHEASTRFGFREAWFDGIHFMLNGVRCNLRGESPSYGEKREMFFTRESASAMLKKYQAVHFNTLRFHSMPAPPHVLDLCDELGMLVIDESAIYASWGMLDPAHPKFMESCREHLSRWVRRDRNHPSVILYSADNEGLNVNLLSPGQLAEFKKVIDAHDGSRGVIFDGDGTAFGATVASVKHYCRTVDDLAEAGGKASGYARDLRSDIYWATNFRQKFPLGMGEFLFPYEPNLKAKEREAIYMMGLQTRGYRFADWFDIRPYNPSYDGFLKPEGVRPGYEEGHEILVKSFAPVAVFDMAYDELGPFPKPPALKIGKEAVRLLVVYNDAFSGTSVDLSWKAESGGKKLAGEQKALTIGLGEHTIYRIAFTPKVAGEVSLELAAAKAGKECFRDSRKFVAEP